MKHTKLLLYLGLFLTLMGCQDVLDKQPLDIISDAVVWQDENLAQAYLNDLYYRTDFVNLVTDRGFNQGMIASMGAEARVYGAWQSPYIASTQIITETGPTSNDVEYWKYSAIRDVNYFIAQMETVSTFNADFIAQKVAEARWLRAYMYFEMVKRYGGVPILTKAQSIDTPKEELFVSRNSEKEVYDFIIAEMDDLSKILPESYTDASRPTKWAAQALKSRAALYAASIAKYGQQQLNGLLGFPASDVQNYAQKAYDASKSIIEESAHELYENNADPTQNFQDLFIDESSANKEVIFAERFDFSQGLGHSLSNRAMPDGFAAGWGSNFNYYYDFVELFEFEDGSPGNSVSRSQLTAQEWGMDELFHNRDPRFKASIFYPESPWQGSIVLFHTSTFVNGVAKNTGLIDGVWPAKAPNRNTTKTGFHLRKRVDEGTVGPLGDQDDTDYYVFRLGEMYLNLAEAAFYLDKMAESLAAINRIRQRAGMPDKTEVTEAIIQNERQVELTFEDHRYWDLRRWRTAVEVLDNVRLQGLRYDYNWDTKKYKISFKNGDGVARVFQERNYYFPLGVDRLADNPNLVENPGY
ncbi:MAG: RagB/SusD family nutrient uptake outer membrane protein [Saprospiraceae bacterium]